MASVPMTALHKEAIRMTAITLLDNLNPTVATYLLAAGIFTRHDLQDINGQANTAAKVNKIIEILPMKEDKAFEEFCKALRETGQKHLVTELEHNLSSLEAGSSGETDPMEPQPTDQGASNVDDVIMWKQGKPNDVELHDLADDLPDWQRFGSQLGVADSKIRGIDNNNVKYLNTQQKGYAMLALWKRSGLSQTYKMLGVALVALGEIEFAAKHCGRKK